MAQKRKRSVAARQKREMQTVGRSKVLDSASAAGIGLWREQGRSHFANHEARIAAMAAQFKGYEMLSFNGCESCGKRDNIQDFFIDDELDAIIMALGSRDYGRVRFLGPKELNYDIAAFQSDLSSVAISQSRALIATSYDRQHPGNVFVARMANRMELDEGLPPTRDSPAPSYSMIGGPETTLWTASPSPTGATQDIVAIGSSDGVYMIDSRGYLVHHHRLTEDVRSVDWLTPTVAVGGTKSKPVYLWDARAAGKSLRFKHTSGVTGVRSLGDGSRVLVSGFQGASVYDTRMVSRPKGPHASSPALVRMAPMKTQFPSVAMDVLAEAQLLATCDDDNMVQLHSLASGRLMGSLSGANPRQEQGRVHRLRFADIDGKPTLTACQGSRLFEWCWGGGADDEG
jgi:WD40 repeat protein